MNDFFTSFYVTEKYHFGMDDTVDANCANFIEVQDTTYKE